MPPCDQSPTQGEDRRLPHLTSPVRNLLAGIDHGYVHEVLDRRLHPYRAFEITKRTRGRRTLHTPDAPLMQIQRSFLHSLLDHTSSHPSAYAYRPRVSLVECAAQHLRADTVIRLDVADFFASIKERHVFEALRSVDWDNAPTWMPRRPSRLALYQLTVLSTVSPDRTRTWTNRGTGRIRVHDQSWQRRYLYRDQREGFLAQGAPTSGALSNLVMRETDGELYRLANRLGLRYTRYSDDLYFSSRRRVDHPTVDALIAGTREALATLDLRLNDAKVRVARSGARRSVLGMLVDGSSLRLPREVHRTIDLHLRGADRDGLAAHAESRGFASVEALESHVSGLIAWSTHVEPSRGAEQQAHWDRSRRRDADMSLDGTHAGAWEPPETSEVQARESIDRLLAQGREFRRSKEYAEFISFLGRFRHYSPFNAAMVKLQRPGARYVATDKVWRAKYRRVLRPGAQPLVIMQPGGPYMVVYDVSDTEALPGAQALPRKVTDPLAATSSLDDSRAQELWDTTVDNAIRDGIRVSLVNNAPAHAGTAKWSQLSGFITRPARRQGAPLERYRLYHEIEVSRHLSPVDRYVTLVHELAHLYCGHIGTPDPQLWPARFGSKPRDEVEAESVAYIVLCRLDPTFRMGDYLLGHLENSGELPDGVGLRQMIHVATEIMRMGKSRLPGSTDPRAEPEPTLF